MQAKFINPFLVSMVNVLTTMAQLEVKPGKAALKTDDEARGVVTGLIALEGEQARGSMAVSFPEAVILDICKRMLGDEKTEVDDEVKDLTGELANMLLGGAKKIFESEGYDFGLTQPKVLSGAEHRVEHPYKGVKIILPFTGVSGEFYVELCFEDGTAD